MISAEQRRVGQFVLEMAPQLAGEFGKVKTVTFFRAGCAKAKGGWTFRGDSEVHVANNWHGLGLVEVLLHEMRHSQQSLSLDRKTMEREAREHAAAWGAALHLVGKAAKWDPGRVHLTDGPNPHNDPALMDLPLGCVAICRPTRGVWLAAGIYSNKRHPQHEDRHPNAISV